jgi:hypothetical protein
MRRIVRTSAEKLTFFIPFCTISGKMPEGVIDSIGAGAKVGTSNRRFVLMSVAITLDAIRGPVPSQEEFLHGGMIHHAGGPGGARDCSNDVWLHN